MKTKETQSIFNQVNEEDAYDNGSGLYEGKSIISKSIEEDFKNLTKQFDESLFKAYINKFSEEDKLKARRILESTIPHHLLIEDELKRLEE